MAQEIKKKPLISEDLFSPNFSKKLGAIKRGSKKSMVSLNLLL